MNKFKNCKPTFIRSLQEPCGCEYFSPQTSPYMLYICFNEKDRDKIKLLTSLFPVNLKIKLY